MRYEGRNYRMFNESNYMNLNTYSGKYAMCDTGRAKDRTSHVVFLTLSHVRLRCVRLDDEASWAFG